MVSIENRKGEIRLLEQWIDGTSLESTLSEQEGWDVTASGFAWHLYQTCLKLLKNIIQTSKDTDGHTGFELRPLKECLSRFFLWGEGFGGGQLDKIIQRSDALKSTILQFIAAIAKILLDNLLPQLKLSSLPREISEVTKELRPLVEKVESISTDELNGSDGDYDDSESDVASVISTRGAPQQHAAKNIDSYVSCLMGLLPTMEHTLNVHDEQDATSSPVEFHVSNAALTYVHNVRDKYKNADVKLVSRLGEANLQRHAAIRQKMAQKESNQDGQAIAEEVEQAPKSMFMPTSIFHDSGLGSMPTTSNIVPTIASHSSFKTDGSQGGKGSFRVPDAPAGAYDGFPFPCSICGHVLKNIKNRYDWKIHVFADLQPYICTFSECADSLRTFPTRKLWQEHEFSQHRSDTTWICPCCEENLSSPDDWKDHVETKHESSLTDVEAQYAFAAAKRTRVQPIELQKCPLCLKSPGTSQKTFTTHVCKHLESIALAALPNEASSDSEAESVSDHSSLRSDPSLSSDLESVKVGSQEWQYEGVSSHKCPISTCQFYTYDFQNMDNQMRHVMIHYKESPVCGFCPGTITLLDMAALKNHITAYHGVLRDKPRRSTTKGNPTERGPGINGQCSICLSQFSNSQDYYNHLDQCVLQKLTKQSLPEEVDTGRRPGVQETGGNNGMVAANGSRDKTGGTFIGKDGFEEFENPEKSAVACLSSHSTPLEAKTKDMSETTNSLGNMAVHRRSRTGCYTCRLRRKKCDEGSPSCTACKQIGLRCEYKRPTWWSNNDQRHVQKDNIEKDIKRKKLSDENNPIRGTWFVEPEGACPHSVQFQGLCGMCGKDMTDMSWASASDDTERAKINMIPDQTTVNQSQVTMPSPPPGQKGPSGPGPFARGPLPEQNRAPSPEVRRPSPPAGFMRPQINPTQVIDLPPQSTPKYEKGDAIRDNDGHVMVYIHSEGEWDNTENEFRYQLREPDGNLYRDGLLVIEHDIDPDALAMDRRPPWNPCDPFNAICFYWNDWGGCHKGKDCQYIHGSNKAFPIAPNPNQPELTTCRHWAQGCCNHEPCNYPHRFMDDYLASIRGTEWEPLVYKAQGRIPKPPAQAEVDKLTLEPDSSISSHGALEEKNDTPMEVRGTNENNDREDSDARQQRKQGSENLTPPPATTSHDIVSPVSNYDHNHNSDATELFSGNENIVSEPKAASSTPARTTQPRGLPRKHPEPASASLPKGGSKTGCITCRKRRKKCDERKPGCVNCERNSVECEGYPIETIWRASQRESVGDLSQEQQNMLTDSPKESHTKARDIDVDRTHITRMPTDADVNETRNQSRQRASITPPLQYENQDHGNTTALDGSELDRFDDLPVNLDHEERFTKDPIKRAHSRGTTPTFSFAHVYEDPFSLDVESVSVETIDQQTHRESSARHKKFSSPIDVDRQCSVVENDDSTSPCRRSLTCKRHPEEAKRLVPGRSMPFDELLAIYHKKRQENFKRLAAESAEIVSSPQNLQLPSSQEPKRPSSVAVEELQLKMRPSKSSPPQTQSARRLPSNLGRYHDGKWYCDCQDFDCLANFFTAGENTPYRNKEFWRCPKSRDNQCSFFLWVEDENKRKERLISYGLLDMPLPKIPTSAKQPRENDSGIGRSLDNPWSLSKRKPEPIYVPDDDEPGSPEIGHKIGEDEDGRQSTQRQSGIKRACNECRQQKLRCDVKQDPFHACSRCTRLKFACKVRSNVKRAGRLSKTAERNQTLGMPQTPLTFEEEYETDDLGFSYPAGLEHKAAVAPPVFQMEPVEQDTDVDYFKLPGSVSKMEDLEFDLEAELEQALDEGELGGPSSESEEE